jgi:NSS family neurotransmitter:Na+ symporter
MLRENGFLQVGLAGFHLAVVMVLVFKGLQNGVEKSVGYMMPVFAAFLVWLMLYSLSLPTAGEALRFLFYPDFSKLSWSSLGQALGHVFFTLSIGFGTMVTFGSYLSDESPIPVAGLRVTVFDTLISLCAGLLIFPILVMHPGSPIGPEVLFQALPQLFQDMGTAGSIFGLAFFVCLYLAALSASLGIMETLVSNLVDRWGISRRLATWLCGVGIFFVGLVPALSSTAFREFRIHERGLLEFLDGALINWFLPLTTLGMCLAVGYALKDESRKNEFFASSRVVIPRIYRDWNAIIRWMAPVLILLALVLQLLDLF